MEPTHNGKEINSDKLIDEVISGRAYDLLLETFKDREPSYVCTWSSFDDTDIADDDLIGMLLSLIVKDESEIETVVSEINQFSESLNLPKSPSITVENIEDGILITFTQYVNRISGEVLDVKFGETYEQKIYDVTE